MIKKTLKGFSKDELEEVLSGVIDILFPDGDQDAEWSADTASDIFELLFNDGCMTMTSSEMQEVDDAGG